MLSQTPFVIKLMVLHSYFQRQVTVLHSMLCLYVTFHNVLTVADLEKTLQGFHPTPPHPPLPLVEHL